MANTDRQNETTSRWFFERVLPGLVGGALVSGALWLFGTMSLFADRLTAALGQQWLPTGALLLVAPQVDCPSGKWEELGAVLVFRENERDGNFVKDFGPRSGEVHGWAYAKPKACIKR